MECVEFLARLDEVLDRRGDPESDLTLAAHAAECLDCRRTLDTAARLVDAVRDAPRPPTPSGLSEAVAVRLEATASDSRAVRWPSMLSLALAASLLMLALPSIVRRPAASGRQDLTHASARSDRPVAERSGRTARGSAGSLSAGSLTGRDSSAVRAASPSRFPTELFGISPLPLLRERGEVLSEIVIAQIPGAGLASLARSSDRLSAKSRAWVNSAADGLKPLAAPVTEAIENLRWVMPHLRGVQQS